MTQDAIPGRYYSRTCSEVKQENAFFPMKTGAPRFYEFFAEPNPLDIQSFCVDDNLKKNDANVYYRNGKKQLTEAANEIVLSREIRWNGETGS